MQIIRVRGYRRRDGVRVSRHQRRSDNRASARAQAFSTLWSDYRRTGRQDAENTIDVYGLPLDLDVTWAAIRSMSDTELKERIVAFLTSEDSGVVLRVEDRRLTKAQQAELLNAWASGWADVAVRELRRVQDEAAADED